MVCVIHFRDYYSHTSFCDTMTSYAIKTEDQLNANEVTKFDKVLNLPYLCQGRKTHFVSSLLNNDAIKD